MHRDDVTLQLDTFARLARESGNPLSGGSLFTARDDMLADRFAECEEEGCKQRRWPQSVICPSTVLDAEGKETDVKVYGCPVCRAKREKRVWKSR